LEGLSRGMQEVGERFEKGEFFLPKLMLSAKVMNRAMAFLKPLLSEDKSQSAGKVMLSTV